MPLHLRVVCLADCRRKIHIPLWILHWHKLGLLYLVKRNRNDLPVPMNVPCYQRFFLVLGRLLIGSPD